MKHARGLVYWSAGVALCVHLLAVCASAWLGFEHFREADLGSGRAVDTRVVDCLEFIAGQPMTMLVSEEWLELHGNLALPVNAITWTLGGALLGVALASAGRRTGGLLRRCRLS